MPTYEFLCKSCGITAEIKRSYEDRDNPVNCLYCNTPLVRVWLTAPGIACHGCPSYEFRRQDSEKKMAARANVKMNDRNQDEIATAAKHNWKLMDAPDIDRETERIRDTMGLQAPDTTRLKEVGA